MMKPLQRLGLTFCKLQYFKVLTLQSPCTKNIKFKNVSLLNNNLIKKRLYHESRVCLNENASVFFDSSQPFSLILEDEKILKSLEHLFPQPRHSLKNFYHLTSINLKMTYKYEINFDKFGEEHKPTYICSIVLNGPIHQTVQAYGKTKKMAENAASIKALELLFKGKHLDVKGRPLQVVKASMKYKVSMREIDNQLYKPIPLNLSEEELLSAEQLIMDYKDTVAPIIQSLASEEDEEDEEQCTEGEEEEETIHNLMTGKELIMSAYSNNERNIKLLEQLNKIRQRKDYSLPIYSKRDEILEAVKNNSVTIIEGGTGCGKSTQVPQILMEERVEGLRGSECSIIIAQPKRIATLSIANQVTIERNERLGQTVGYKMRLDEQMLQQNGGFMFYTCGNLREVLRLNPSLKGISHVIIDEIHERSIDTDLLMFLVKRALKHNSTLKVILMSATSNIDELKSYFETDSVVTVPPGTVFPIQTYHIEDIAKQLGLALDTKQNEIDMPKSIPVMNYKLITQLITHIHQTKPEGAVLVFVPGWQDIKNLQLSLQNFKDLHVLPLHSKLPTSNQYEIFVEAPEGKRKIILATNIAETSLTIPDVIYVIDSGLQNDSRFDIERNMAAFGTFWISKANAIQRKGRTGRVQPGDVYRLYDEKTFMQMEEYPKPDIFKLPLESIILKCKSFFEDMDVRELLNELMSPPQARSVEKAIEMLSHLQLLNCDMGGINEKLTPLGRTLSIFSTNPIFSKPLIYGALLGCVDPALNIACLENQFPNLFANPQKNAEMRYLKEEYNEESDLLATSRFVDNAFEALERWRQENEGSIALDLEEDSFNKKEERDINVFDDESVIADSINGKLCPQRLTNFHQIRTLFQHQVENSLPQIDQTNNFLKEVWDLEDESSPDSSSAPELILASFLSAASSLIRRVTNNRRNASALVLENSTIIEIDSSSVLKDLDFNEDKKEYFFSNNLFHSQARHRAVARELSSVSTLSVAIFYGEDLEILSCDGDVDPILTVGIKDRNVMFHMNERTSKCVLSLRKLWNNIMNYYMELPVSRFKDSSKEEDQKLKVVTEFLYQYRRLLSQLLKEKENVDNESEAEI